MNLNRKDHTNAVIESLLAAKIAVFKVDTSNDIAERDTILLANGYSLALDYGSVASHGLVRVDFDRDVSGRKSDTLHSWEMPPMTHAMLVSAISHEFNGRVNLDEAWLLAKASEYKPEYAQPRMQNPSN